MIGRGHVGIAMSTIAGITENLGQSYTVVGGNELVQEENLSLVLLNRGGRFRLKAVIDKLYSQGFKQLCIVEVGAENREIEELVHKYSGLRFIVFARPLSIGQYINIVAKEMSGEYFLIVWDNINQIQGGGSKNILERVSSNNSLLLSPHVLNEKWELSPTVKNPYLTKGKVEVLPSLPVHDGQMSLYPHDYIGLYHRAKFLELGGYDSDIEQEWVQLLDFGFRCYLFGYDIRMTGAFKLVFDQDLNPEDQSIKTDINKFWIKNIAPIFANGSAHLPWRRFFPWLLRSGEGPVESLMAFKQARRWVYLNRYRFKSDAKGVIENWESDAL